MYIYKVTITDGNTHRVPSMMHPGPYRRMVTGDGFYKTYTDRSNMKHGLWVAQQQIVAIEWFEVPDGTCLDDGAPLMAVESN